MSDPNSDGALQPVDTLDGSGETCATLTPVIAGRMRALSPGEGLEVISDDSTAPEALASWSRLTGNSLVEVHDEGNGRRRFLLRRKG